MVSSSAAAPARNVSFAELLRGGPMAHGPVATATPEETDGIQSADPEGDGITADAALSSDPVAEQSTLQPVSPVSVTEEDDGVDAPAAETGMDIMMLLLQTVSYDPVDSSASGPAGQHSSRAGIQTRTETQDAADTSAAGAPANTLLPFLQKAAPIPEPVFPSPNQNGSAETVTKNDSAGLRRALESGLTGTAATEADAAGKNSGAELRRTPEFGLTGTAVTEADAASLLNINRETASPLMAPTPARGNSPAMVTAPVTLELVSPANRGWSQALGQQLVWMVQHQTQQAELRVDPPHLGPVEVHLSWQLDHAEVTFFSHDASVRETIENALPRLREMLGAQGLQLGQAHVSDQSPARRQPGSHDQSSRQDRWQTGNAPDEVVPDQDEPLSIRTRLGLVDHYI